MKTHFFQKKIRRAALPFPSLSFSFPMSRRGRHDTRDEKFDKVVNYKLYETLKVGTFLKFEGVDAKVVEGPTKIDRTNVNGVIEHDYRIRIKPLAPSISLLSEYLDASLHQIHVLEEVPVYQVLFLFLYNFNVSHTIFSSLAICDSKSKCSYWNNV